MKDPQFTTVIGLEVHVQLATRSKLFCRCSTRFGAEPNTQTCPVCIGLPGALPVMNRQAHRLALIAALALRCEIPNYTKWDRKQYYYPDLPKGYQISQYDLPMSQHGRLAVSDPQARCAAKEVGIVRAHLEEDAGKSMHDEIAGREDSRIDLNRTGTPLLEIVTAPDLRSPLEARLFLEELKLLLTYLEVSDCNMQEGSLRVDANVNLHVPAEQEPIATPIVEIKNMNSFRAVERALAYEADRQWQVWLETGCRLGMVPKQTRGWDDGAGITTAQRSKEESSDYRYFPDPDLVPVTISDAEIEALRGQIGELPAALRQRLISACGLGEYDAGVLVNQGRPLVDYFLQVAAECGEAKLASNWVQRDVLRHLKEENLSIEQFPVPAGRLAELIRAIQAGTVDSSRGAEVFDFMLARQAGVDEARQALGIASLGDDALEQLCRQLLRENPRVVADVRGGKQQAVGALIGQAKKKNANAPPERVRRLCLELIARLQDE